MKKSKERYLRGITIISLVVTIIVLLILAGVTITILLEDNGIIKKTQKAATETEKQVATETMNFKITNIQMKSYVETQQLPSLQYLADNLCEDDDMEYVSKVSKIGSLDAIDVSDVSSIYTKLKDYPYEFEINGFLQLASIDGVKVATGNDDTVTLTKEQYNSILNRISALEEKSNGLGFIDTSKELAIVSKIGSQDSTSGFWVTSAATANSSYTATEDCNISGWIAVYNSITTDDKGGVNILVNDVSIMRLSTTDNNWSVKFPINLYLKKGDTIKIELVAGSVASNVKAYALK